MYCSTRRQPSESSQSAHLFKNRISDLPARLTPHRTHFRWPISCGGAGYLEHDRSGRFSRRATVQGLSVRTESNDKRRRKVSATFPGYIATRARTLFVLDRFVHTRFVHTRCVYTVIHRSAHSSLVDRHRQHCSTWSMKRKKAWGSPASPW